jgi:hypothetical protein
MKHLFAHLGLSFAFVLTTPSVIGAVQSAPVQENSTVKWSQVVEDAFDGRVVYDKHFTNRFTFVSSWSKQGIRATYTQKDTVLLGYRTTWETRWVADGQCDHYKKRHQDDNCKPRQKLESYPVQEPIYKTFRTDRIPRKIFFALNRQAYSYERGAVSPELAAALFQAADENMRIRLEWDNGDTTDMEIGQGTVRAWKTIFKPNN